MENFRNLTQAYSQAPWRKQLKFIGLFLLLVVFVALIAGIYLDVTARSATMGREILIMKKDIDTLVLVVADLETQLAFMTSSDDLEKRALSLGFQPVEIDQAMYLIVDGYLAPDYVNLAPLPETVKTVPANLPPDFTESLFDWLGQNVLPPVDQVLGVKP
jgi:hypothetical protein